MRLQPGINALSVRSPGNSRGATNVQRKVFRIEQMAAGRHTAPPAVGDAFPDTDNAPRQTVEITPAIAHELHAIRELVANHKRELSALFSEGTDRRMARSAGELAAAVECMETATQKVLASVETIDDCARALATVVTDDYHHGLAQDVQDHVVRIYEACNFQDLAGQRIGKVIATLMMVEEQLAAMIERCGGPTGHEKNVEPGLINGPRLDGDTGHATQQDIDLMFA